MLRRGWFYHLLSLAHRLGLDLLILTGHLSLVWYLLDMTGVSGKLLRVAWNLPRMSHLLDKLLRGKLLNYLRLKLLGVTSHLRGYASSHLAVSHCGRYTPSGTPPSAHG